MASCWKRNIAANMSIQRHAATAIQMSISPGLTLSPHFSYSGPDLASIKKDGNTPSAFGGSKCLPLYTADSWGVYIVERIQATCLYVFLMQFSFYKPLEFAAFSAMTMTSLIPTGTFPGKVLILKKCCFPMKIYSAENFSLVLSFGLIERLIFLSDALHTQEILDQDLWYCGDCMTLQSIFCKSSNTPLWVPIPDGEEWQTVPGHLFLLILHRQKLGLPDPFLYFLGQKSATFGRSSNTQYSALPMSSV